MRKRKSSNENYSCVCKKELSKYYMVTQEAKYYFRHETCRVCVQTSDAEDKLGGHLPRSTQTTRTKLCVLLSCSCSRSLPGKEKKNIAKILLAEAKKKKNSFVKEKICYQQLDDQSEPLTNVVRTGYCKEPPLTSIFAPSME